MLRWWTFQNKCVFIGLDLRVLVLALLTFISYLEQCLLILCIQWLVLINQSVMGISLSGSFTVLKME